MEAAQLSYPADGKFSWRGLADTLQAAEPRTADT
jgi:hypothetical protein